MVNDGYGIKPLTLFETGLFIIFGIFLWHSTLSLMILRCPRCRVFVTPIFHQESIELRWRCRAAWVPVDFEGAEKGPNPDWKAT